MATRVTETEVKEIISTDLTDEQIAPFLAAASVLVTDLLNDEDYSDDLLKEIERWLTAHLVAIRDPQISQETIGDMTVKYHGSSGLGLNHTPYGQQVMLLDYNGKLAEVQSGSKIISAKIKAIV